MGRGLVRVRLLRLHAGTESSGTDKRALQERSRRLVEKPPGHAQNSDPRRISTGSEDSNDRIPVRQIIASHYPVGGYRKSLWAHMDFTERFVFE